MMKSTTYDHFLSVHRNVSMFMKINEIFQATNNEDMLFKISQCPKHFFLISLNINGTFKPMGSEKHNIEATSYKSYCPKDASIAHFIETNNDYQD